MKRAYLAGFLSLGEAVAGWREWRGGAGTRAPGMATGGGRSVVAVVAAATAVTAVTALAHAWTERRRRRSQGEQTRVMRLWFGRDESEASDLGKTVWFVGEGPQRDALDAAITSEFGELVERALGGELDADWSTTPRGTLALIVVLDQLARHVWRARSTDPADVASDKRRRIDACNDRALAILDKALSRGDADVWDGAPLAFLLMPCRHVRPVPRARDLERVLALVDRAEQRALRRKAVLSRFKRQTEAALASCPAEEKQTYSDADILEPMPPSPVDPGDPTRLSVFRAVQAYAESRPRDEPLLVSLSGGVDSMVMTEILVRLRDAEKQVGAEAEAEGDAPRKRTIAAVHIDYGNRPESGAEADFVERWCSARGVRFFCTRVGETGLLRGVTERDEYEKKSKELRFDAYARAWRDLAQTSTPRVLFGHHEGDVVENVLSNALKGRTILELSGMTPESELMGVVVARPMLRLPKTVIYDFSHRFGVPYFLDTTPRWSTRGQVRNEALPVLSRVYGTGFPEHLASLALQSDDLDAYLSHAGAMRAFQADAVTELVDWTRTVAGVFVDLEAIRALPAFMWRLGLRRAAHVGGVPAPRDRAVDQLRDRFTVEGMPPGSKRSSAKQSPGETRGVWFVELRHGVHSAVFFNRYLVMWRADAVVYSSDDVEVEVEVDAPEPVVVSGGSWSVRVVSTEPAREEAVPLTPEAYFAHCVSVRGSGPERERERGKPLTYAVPFAPTYVVSRAVRPNAKDLPGFSWPLSDCERRMWLLPQVSERPWVTSSSSSSSSTSTSTSNGGRAAKKALKQARRWVVVEFLGRGHKP